MPSSARRSALLPAYCVSTACANSQHNGYSSVGSQTATAETQRRNVIYQLRIGRLPDSRTRTSMTEMRTPEEAGDVSC
jgi:hypothetical protein